MKNTKVGARWDVVKWLKRFQHVFKALVLYDRKWPHVCSYKHTDNICDGFSLVGLCSKGLLKCCGDKQLLSSLRFHSWQWNSGVMSLQMNGHAWCFHCHVAFLCHSAYTPSQFYPLTFFFFFINQSTDHVCAEPIQYLQYQCQYLIIVHYSQ